ncbi:MAG: hypothetical protein ACOCRK_00715 [bacterium]
MIENWKLIAICSGFSLFAALLKQLFDVKYYPKNMYIFIIDVLLSALCGIILALVLSSYIEHELTIIGISGLGGLLGVSSIKILMKFKLGQKIKIQIGFEEDEDELLDEVIKKKDD